MKDFIMLIEFRVKNYRSIKDEQSLSMVASSDDTLLENTFTPKKNDKRRTINRLRYLKSAVTYGANASGKSNLFKAMRSLFYLLSETDPRTLSLFFPGDHPWFMLARECAALPTQFTVIFALEDDIQYDFLLAFHGNRVIEERLDYYPRGRASTLYHRKLGSPTSKKYSWSFPGGNLKGDKVGLREKTADDSLFLSVAASFNHPQLLPVVAWFRSHVTMSSTNELSRNLRVRQYENFLQKNPDSVELANKWLTSADLGIQGFRFEKRERERRMRAPGGAIETRTVEMADMQFVHNGSQGLKAHIRIDEESSGTQRWFELFFKMSQAIESGGVLLIDEISADLHPLLVEYFFRVFHNPRMNPKNAQLICTTHHSSLLGAKILRRDQIWFAEKDKEGASHYYSLLEFSPRKDEAFMRGYLAGSYGAIPDTEEIGGLIALRKK